MRTSFCDAEARAARMGRNVAMVAVLELSSVRNRVVRGIARMRARRGMASSPSKAVVREREERGFAMLGQV